MNAATGHGGGDAGPMDAFTGAMATGNRELILSGPRASLASHRAVFAAERARQNGTSEQSRTRGKQMHHRELAGDHSGETSSVSRSRIPSPPAAGPLNGRFYVRPLTRGGHTP